ncbi:EpsG family protein [Aeromonas veronii]|uniref:EpsG family protein n=1 Tax=Aeromonas veronii TaxID=654 RepID=UPI0038D32250
MLIYNLLLFLCLPSIFIRNEKFLFFIILLLTVFCGTRLNILGYDYFVYQDYYNNILIDGNVYSYEPFFYWFAHTCSSLGLSYNVFLFLISMLFHWALFLFLIAIKRHLYINVGVVLSLYVSTIYFWHSYTIIRQSFSISIFYIFLSSFLSSGGKKNTWVNYLGLGFHISHLSCMIFYMLSVMKLSLRNLFFISIFIFVIIYYSPLFMLKLEQYRNGGAAGVFPVIEFLFSMFVIYLLTSDNKRLLIMSFLGFCIALFSVMYSEVFVRFLEPFRIIIPISWAYLYRFIGSKNREIAVVFSMLLILYAFFRLNYFILNFGDYSIPYQNIFFTTLS